MKSPGGAWLGLYRQTFMLGLEASAVMALRGAKIAAGGHAAQDEMQLMVSEKIEAGLALQTRAVTGALGLTPEKMAMGTLSHYRKKVRANRRRLSKI
jgi:hypothetical protein